MMNEQTLSNLYGIGILASNISAGLQNPKIREGLIQILNSVLGDESTAIVLRDHAIMLQQRKFGDKLQKLNSVVIDVCTMMLIDKVDAPEIETEISKLIGRDFKLNKTYGEVFVFLERLDREQDIQFNLADYRRYIDEVKTAKDLKHPSQDSIEFFYESLDQGSEALAFRKSPEYSLWQLNNELKKNPPKPEQLLDFIDKVDQSPRLRFITAGLKEEISYAKAEKIDDLRETLKEQFIIRFSDPNDNLELRFKDEARNAISALGLDYQTFSNALVL